MPKPALPRNRTFASPFSPLWNLSAHSHHLQIGWRQAGRNPGPTFDVYSRFTEISESEINRIAKLKASTEEVEAQAERELRRNLEIRASFYEKLTTLDAGSIAVAVSVGIALLSKGATNSGSLHANLGWLVAIAFFLWLSLICSILHNVLHVKVAHLEAEKANEGANWIGLNNAAAMSSIYGNSDTASSLIKIIGDNLHDRIRKGAINLHLIEQSVLRAKLLGWLAVASFVTAYSLIFICILRIWWMTR